MSLFGTSRDVSLIRHINRELINNIIEQQVGYYKIVLNRSTSNIYGESNGEKIYNDPVLINCLIERNPQSYTTDEFGADVSRDISVRFLKDDLMGSEYPADQSTEFNFNIKPEVGDIILWNENYYEVDSIVENQLFVGKDPMYSYSTDNGDFGNSLSVIVTCHYTRPEKLGLKQERL